MHFILEFYRLEGKELWRSFQISPCSDEEMSRLNVLHCFTDVRLEMPPRPNAASARNPLDRARFGASTKSVR